ncbi:MAG: hypothetical protein MK181_09400 [Acidimicrobiales bacterium]|nr:hypothetical protein [Acidimicrobiales bacterium]
MLRPHLPATALTLLLGVLSWSCATNASDQARPVPTASTVTATTTADLADKPDNQPTTSTPTSMTESPLGEEDAGYTQEHVESGSGEGRDAEANTTIDDQYTGLDEPATSTVTPTTVAGRLAGDSGGSMTGDHDTDGKEADPRPAFQTAVPTGTVVDGHYADPRGSIYTEFQAGFDRNHPFQSLEAFCLPAPPPEDDPVDVEPGISAEAVTIVHLHTRLDELERIGFAAPVGEVDAMARTFVDIVNSECGGIHGRRLDLRTVDVSALGGGGFDIDTLREAACLEAVEVHRAVAVLAVEAVPGTAARCLTRTHRTSFMTIRGISDRDLGRAGGLLLALEPGDRTSLRLAVSTAAARGVLTGATIGIVTPDAPQRSDDVVEVLLEALAERALVATVHQLGCEGTTPCRVGMETAVAGMLEAGVDLVFPLLDRTTLPWLVLEMIDQGMPAPTFVQSGLDGQGLDVVASEVAEFGGSPAGSYYDGAWILDGSATGSHRRDGFESRPFDDLCNRELGRVAGHDPAVVDDPSDDVYRTVVEACSLVRAVARAVYDAGPNPSRLAIQVNLAALGNLDAVDMRPVTSMDGSLTVQVSRYEYPCLHGPGFGASAGCVFPITDPVPVG